MLKFVENQFKKLGIKKTDPILLAVSGGVDSMVLWSILRELNQKHLVAHVNFSLREQESNLDAALVESIAKKNDVPFLLKKVETTAYATKKKISIQMAAREIRYNWFSEIKSSKAIKTLATAHHLEDNVETFFINLNRGTGINGLIGIPSNEETVRPLLTFTKEEIRTYALKNEIEFREDQSNQSKKYDRNWFRHEILSPWKERNPQFLDAMQLTLGRLKKTQQIIDTCIKTEVEKVESNYKKGYIEIEVLQKLQFSKEVLFKLLSKDEFSEDQIENILQAANSKKTGKVFSSRSIELLIDREKIICRKRNSLSKKKKGIWINMETTATHDPLPLKLSIKAASEFKITHQESSEAFDLSKLQFPLELRGWQKGDWMIPLGMKGRKNVSDILTDKKVSLFEKEKIVVLCSNKMVVWLVGYQIDERFKIDQNTEKVLNIEWKEK